ncbi:copper chaperone PCu(A)C [Xylophilus sp. Kf1]|nr:copper chaperone PCu(A)C [Xylophilus sp. Kf1]
MSSSLFQAALAGSVLCATAAFAHVTLPPGGATAGSRYDAAFRVGHPCQGSASTQSVAVQLPDGFTLQSAVPRDGWTLTTAGRTVTWKADRPGNALPQGERAEFVVRGQLTDKPGTLFFKVLQGCDKGASDWAQLPADPQDKPAFPAARLEVLAAGVAPVEVKDAWVRTAVKGQSGTGAFMKLTAPSGSRLVGVSTPDAGLAEVHEMKMDGDVMRMRPLPGLDLPARQPVELKPGSFHLMLTQLKQALPVGATVPVTLQFVDAEGRRSTAQLQLPVLAAPPGGAPAMEHMPGMKH